MGKTLASVVAFGSAALAFVPSFARADIQHTIGKGHTIQAIANRYHVAPQAIMDANHLKDVKHLKVGDVLTIPKAETPKEKEAKAKAAKDGKADGKSKPEP